MSPLSVREKFQSKQLVKVFGKSNTVPKATKLHNNISTSVSLIYTFSVAGNIIVYTHLHGSNREKNFDHTNCKGKMPTLAGKTHLSVLFFLRGPRLFHLSKEKVRVQSVRNGHQRGYCRAYTINNNINKR